MERKEDKKIMNRNPCRELEKLRESSMLSGVCSGGELATISRDVAFYVALFDIRLSKETIQKTVILRTTRILGDGEHFWL